MARLALFFLETANMGVSQYSFYCIFTIDRKFELSRYLVFLFVYKYNIERYLYMYMQHIMTSA